MLADRLAPLIAQRVARPADDWLTTRDAAAYLRLGVSTVHRLAKAGDMPAHQDVPGGKYAFERSELDEWRRAK